jgi:hypothetical protein
MHRTLTPVVALLVAAACAVAAVLVAVAPTSAFAGDGWGDVNCVQDPTRPECVVTVITGGDSSSAGAGTAACRDFTGDPAPCFLPDHGWNAGDGCYYQPALPGWADAFGHPDPPAAWYEGWCGSVAHHFTVVTRMRIFGQPPGQALLVEEALRRLALPTPGIHLNPPPPAAQLVHVPTWLWLDTPAWTARSATASVPGLSVTATARPTSVVWSTGDGATVTCTGPGTPWAVGTDPAAASPDCGHTYTTVSGPGTFSLRATISWAVTWAGGGFAGTEPALTSTAALPVTVAASVALNTQGR